MMVDKIKIYTVLLACVFVTYVSAQTEQDNVLGRYIKKEPYASATLELLRNNVAKYDIKTCLISNSFKGVWELKKDTLKLSFGFAEKLKKGSIEVKHLDTINNNKKEVIISLIDEDGIPIRIASTVFIDDKKYIVDNFEGEIRIAPLFIDSIKVTTFGLDEKTISIEKYIESDLLLSFTYDEHRPFFYNMVKTKWLVDENKLIAIKNDSLIENYVMIRVHLPLPSR